MPRREAPAPLRPIGNAGLSGTERRQMSTTQAVSENKDYLGFFVEPQTAEQLRRLAKDSERSISAEIRLAVKEHLRVVKGVMRP